MTGRILIHAGFHKTGTTTVQATLEANRAALRPHARIALRPRLQALLQAARAYSTWRDPLSLTKVTIRAAPFFAGLTAFEDRSLILSAEELSGHMPGRAGIADYGAAAQILPEVVRAATAAWPGAEVTVALTLRDPADWLRSAHWEHVKSSSMTEGFDSFAERMRPAADLGAAAARIAADLHPVALHTVSLEQAAGGPLGPAAPLLRLAAVPDPVIAGLVPVPPANRSRDALLGALLDINRSIADPRDRGIAKRRLLDGDRSAT